MTGSRFIQATLHIPLSPNDERGHGRGDHQDNQRSFSKFLGRERGSAVGATQSQMLYQVDRAAPDFAKVRDLYSKTFRLGERVKEGAVALKKGNPQLM